MRVLFNGFAASGARTGVGHYAAEVLRCLQARLGPEQVVNYPYSPAFLQAKGWYGGVRAWLERPSRSGKPILWRRWALEGLGWLKRLARRGVDAATRARRWDGFDLYHEPNFLPLPVELPTVVTIHDLSVLLHPEWHPADRLADFQAGFDEAARRADHVLAISETGRQEIIRTLGLPPDRVTRTYMGARPAFRPLPADAVARRLAEIGLPPRYLLHVGTVEPRKNLSTLLRAYCDLPAAARESCPLVLVGGWGWKSGDVRDYLQNTARHRGVVHAGYVAEADLATVYNGARALVFPTLYEGFGMPTVEMFACGGAVLASTAGAVAEVAGGQGHLVEPLDVGGWRDAMRRVIEDDDWHASLCAGGPEVAARFTWEQCAADTEAAYRAVLGQRQSRAA